MKNFLNEFQKIQDDFRNGKDVFNRLKISKLWQGSKLQFTSIIQKGTKRI